MNCQGVNSKLNTIILVCLVGYTISWKKKVDIILDNQFKIMEDLKIIRPEE